MKKSVFLHPVLKRMIMSQRLQSIFFFFSALLLALLFFLPFASFYGDFHTFDLFGYGITSPDNWENGASPFSMTFSLPILVLTVTAMVLCGYLAMGLFRAIKLSQFQKLHKIARIAIIVIVACIAGVGNSLVTETQEKNYNDFARITMLFGWIMGVGSAMLLCFLATIYPARQAAGLEPAEALRYE